MSPSTSGPAPKYHLIGKQANEIQYPVAGDAGVKSVIVSRDYY
jgi:hypothetical protein